MKNIFSITFFALFLYIFLSISLFAEVNDDYYCSQEPYSYFIYNEASLTQEQLEKIIQLKTEYQPRIAELRNKMYLEKVKMNLEMSKKNPDALIINNSMKLNNEYSKEFRKIANEFLKEYNKIKNNR